MTAAGFEKGDLTKKQLKVLGCLSRTKSMTVSEIIDRTNLDYDDAKESADLLREIGCAGSGYRLTDYGLQLRRDLSAEVVYVILGVEFQNQLCYWDNFQESHTIQTSPWVFHTERDTLGRWKLCESSDYAMMCDQVKRLNRGADRYGLDATWWEYGLAIKSDFSDDELRGGEIW